MKLNTFISFVLLVLTSYFTSAQSECLLIRNELVSEQDSLRKNLISDIQKDLNEYPIVLYIENQNDNPSIELLKIDTNGILEYSFESLKNSSLSKMKRIKLDIDTIRNQLYTGTWKLCCFSEDIQGIVYEYNYVATFKYFNEYAIFSGKEEILTPYLQKFPHFFGAYIDLLQVLNSMRKEK